MNEELIRMEGICKYFPGVKALENVSITVRAGEVHALLGENGAGKSTLIKILNGVYRPDKGKIFVRGKEVQINDISDAQRLGIGIIFQEYNLCPDINVAENVFIGRQKKNRFGLVDRRYVERETQKVLDKVGLNNIKPTDLVRRMSSSQMQMVEIAKAISMESDLIVFDEPTAALTEGETKILFRIIRDLCKHGKGIIYISHRMEELREIADIWIFAGVKKRQLACKAELYELNGIVHLKIIKKEKPNYEETVVPGPCSGTCRCIQRHWCSGDCVLRHRR